MQVLIGEFPMKGPIIRVSPDEIHIRDSDYWEEVFSKNPQVDRYDLEEKRFGNSNSVFSTPSAAVHRRRRAVLNPMLVSYAGY